jgi:hypothetical protein
VHIISIHPVSSFCWISYCSVFIIYTYWLCFAVILCVKILFLVEQGLLTIPEYSSSSLVFLCGFVLLNIQFFVQWFVDHCLSVGFLLSFLRFTVSDYSFWYFQTCSVFSQTHAILKHVHIANLLIDMYVTI